MVVDFDPVIVYLGPIQIRYYGLMYVIGFITSGYLGKYLSRHGYFKISEDKIDSLITHLLIGLFIGARLVYVLVYNFDSIFTNPLDIIAVWKGGLSFHGGVLGLALGGYVFVKKNRLNYWNTFDCGATAGVQGLFFGRIGNFINGELYGRHSDAPWAMIFPAGGPLPRHPSQLYEAIFEGLVLFLILWSQKKRAARPGTLTAIFLVGYGFFRYCIEFFRQPDSQMGYYFGGTTTMGQILCLTMILIGISIYVYTRKLPQLEIKK
jgi:phosphatidylglycerol:prolipoprotein diacylglycerol transferase